MKEEKRTIKFLIRASTFYMLAQCFWVGFYTAKAIAGIGVVHPSYSYGWPRVLAFFAFMTVPFVFGVLYGSVKWK